MMGSSPRIGLRYSPSLPEMVRGFDGDEMNLHMPQDPESEAELKNLAAVPYQIVSPANNSTIIGIYQDSMLGSYQFTRENIHFTPRQAMNILMIRYSKNMHTYTYDNTLIYIYIHLQICTQTHTYLYTNMYI